MFKTVKKKKPKGGQTKGLLMDSRENAVIETLILQRFSFVTGEVSALTYIKVCGLALKRRTAKSSLTSSVSVTLCLPQSNAASFVQRYTSAL